jgi:anthranilate synthase component II
LKILVLDNYDSFTYNLVHLLEKCSHAVIDVKKNNEISLTEINAYDKVLLSPGPGLPSEAGIMPKLITEYGHKKPILGVCLGMQAIGESFGGTLLNLKDVCHGIKSQIKVLNDDGLFKNCPKHFFVGRYHSWVLDPSTLPDCFRVTAVDESGNIMAIAHNTLPVKGVQFHPESVLSEYGEHIISNWLNTN